MDDGSFSTWRQRRDQLEVLLLSLAALLHQDALLDQRVLIDRSIQSSDDLLQRGATLPACLVELRRTLLQLDDFEIVATLSTSGPFARVELAQPIRLTDASGLQQGRSGQLLVIKTVERSWGYRTRFHNSASRELDILLLSRSHPNAAIPRLMGTILSASHFHLVLSHAAGGDLASFLEIRLDGVVEEGLVARWIAEAVDALAWLHARGWCHRDVKPNNLLLDQNGRILLTDFGSAAPLFSSASAFPSTTSTLQSIAAEYAQVLVGTPDYIAPEILLFAEFIATGSFDADDDSDDGDAEKLQNRAYGYEVDYWSIGVVMYELLYGQTPFFAESIPDTYERIIQYATALAFPPESAVSEGAQDLIRRLLISPDARFTAQHIKAHDWFKLTPPVTYVPPAFAVHQSTTGITYGSQSPPRNEYSKAFDFSDFFSSSPGLSIFHSSPRAVTLSKNQEEEYWIGMTVLPERDAFELSSPSSPPLHPSKIDVRLQDTKSYPPSTNPRIQQLSERSAPSTVNQFETPPRFTRSSPSHSSSAAAPRSSSRARRMLSSVDAWKEMQAHAYEVGMTAKKKKSKVSAMQEKGAEMIEKRKAAKGDEELNQLFERHDELKEGIYSIQQKYKALFDLASSDSRSGSG